MRIKWGGGCSAAQSCLTLWDPMDCSTPDFSVYHQLPDSSPLSRWCHPTISSSVVSLSSCLLSFPASGSFQISWLFASIGQSLELQLQHQSFQWMFRVDFLQDWLIWYPCCPRDFQESSLTHFKSIDSLAFSLLYGPTLTSVHDHWKNHSFD